MVPSPNNRTSSMKRVCVTSSVSDTLMPFIAPSYLSLWVILLKSYATNRKMKGERGQPCLRPLVVLIKLEGDPLIRTSKEVDCRQPIIHSTNSGDTPIFISNNTEISQILIFSNVP